MLKSFTQPIFCFLFCLVLTTEISAQDPRFSQYYASPWNLNPAMTGVFNGSWRATVNYRDQWNSFLTPVPFRTYSAAFETRINVANDDYASFGLGAMHDEAGTARYAQNKVQLGGAFLKQLSGGYNRSENYLSAGAQVGFGQNSLDWSKLWFSHQFNTTTETPDFNAPSNEAFAGLQSKLYLDFNAGLLWYTVFGDNGFFYAGGAMHHLNKPKISLQDDDGETLYTRWSAHAGGQLPVTENFALLPGAQVMKQGPAMETDLGLNLRYSNNDVDELAMRFGAWARVGNKLDRGFQMDAITIVGMLELNRWMLGLSYDVTVSGLTLANNSRGAFEVSLTYFHPEHRRSRVTCPKF